MALEVRNLSLSQPLLICCDLQNGHCQPGERRFMVDFEPTVKASRTLLDMWRSKSWPVAHLKRISDSGWFPRSQPSLDWIDSVSPRPSELVFEHYLPSAYSSARYTDYMRGMREMSCILAGFSLDETILSTAVDGFHRGHRYYVACDAVAARRPPSGSPQDYRFAATNLVQNFAGLLSTADIADIWESSNVDSLQRGR